MEYFYRMLQQRPGPSVPLISTLRGTRCVLESVRCISIPHFDSDGGCDPYLILTNGDGQVYSQRAHSGSTFKPQHYSTKKHLEIRLDSIQDDSSFSAAGLRIFRGLTLHGAVKIELWDYDTSSKDDLMCSAWFHCDMVDPTALLPTNDRDLLSRPPALSLVRDQVEGPHLDKKFRHFDSDFRLDVFLQSVRSSADAAGASGNGADAGAATNLGGDTMRTANRGKMSGPTSVSEVGQQLDSVSSSLHMKAVPAKSLESELHPQWQQPQQPQPPPPQQQHHHWLLQQWCCSNKPPKR